MTSNKCGECNACCRVFAIPEDNRKPAGTWCSQCEIGVGCRIYDTRPERCRGFECLWLITQSMNPGFRFDLEMRPDKCKVVFSGTTNESVMLATPLPGYPAQWRTHAGVQDVIATVVRAGGAVAVQRPGAMTSLLIDESGEKVVQMTEPDEDGMQWPKEWEGVR